MSTLAVDAVFNFLLKGRVDPVPLLEKHDAFGLGRLEMEVSAFVELKQLY